MLPRVAVVTAGQLVFYGTMDGWFKALDARNGSLLWRFKTAKAAGIQPLARFTYRGPENRPLKQF